MQQHQLCSLQHCSNKMCALQCPGRDALLQYLISWPLPVIHMEPKTKKIVPGQKNLCSPTLFQVHRQVFDRAIRSSQMLSWAWQYLSGDPNAAIISLSLHPVIMPAVFTLCSIVTAAPRCCILTLQQCRIKCSCKPLQSPQVFTQLCHCSCSRHTGSIQLSCLCKISHTFLTELKRTDHQSWVRSLNNHDLVLVKH